MLLILITVDRVRGDVGKLVVFVRFPVAVGTRSGYLGDNVTDNLYLGLVVGGILDAVTSGCQGHSRLPVRLFSAVSSWQCWRQPGHSPLWLSLRWRP